MNRKYWLFIGMGLVVGPVLLYISQALEYTAYNLAVYRHNNLAAYDIFKQHACFDGHYAFLIIGILLGGVSGGLLAAWHNGDGETLRRIVITGVVLGFIASCVTVFHWDFQSGVGYVGGPATSGLWAARVFYNATVKWNLIFAVMGMTMLPKISRRTK